MADQSQPGSFVTPIGLQTESESEPRNVSPSAPRFSWHADAQSGKQTAYRLLVSCTTDALKEGRGTMWDSGRVESPNSTDISYNGVPLSSDTEYFWTVRIWDENNSASMWADPVPFMTALGESHEWEGEWISYQPNGGDTNGHRSEWHPADAEIQEWAQIDLGDPADIGRVVLYPTEPFNGPETPDGMPVSANYSVKTESDERASVDGPQTRGDGPAGFGFPIRYRIEVSDDPDFSKSEVIVDRTNEQYNNPGLESVSIDTDTIGRYVRITATELYQHNPTHPPTGSRPRMRADYVREERRPWKVFALAAVAIEDHNGNNLALDQPVQASSSIEEDGWSKSNLVDGLYESQTAHGSPLLRTVIDLEKEIKSARVHYCGVGYSELYVNGRRVGDEVLDPGWTEYDERVLYNSCDIGDRLQAGKNGIGLWLGRGWFSKNVRDWTGHGAPRAILQLNVTYTDGTTRSVSTDSSWNASPSPILENDIYDGETYDARKEKSTWTQPEFKDGDWDSATVVKSPGGQLVPQRTPPIRVTETIDPDEILDREEGPIIDFGQNLVGWIKLNIENADEGDQIKLHHAETLKEDGSLSQVDLRSADATDTYISCGDATEEYSPRFTYHGFRYAQIVDCPDRVDIKNICAEVVHTDLETSGSFDCSNDDFSQIQENARWGLRGNLHSVLTGCPQRDERFGWTGDNHIVTRTLLYNFNSVRFYEKWMNDHKDVQSEHGYVADTIPYGSGVIPEDPTWAITQVTVPWHLYRHYGDTGILKTHYEEMRQYIDYWYEESNYGIIPDEYGMHGDWLAFENTDGRSGLPYDLFNTAFHYHTTNLFKKIAEVLGHKADVNRYGKRAESIADAFNREFFDSKAGQYGPGTQSSYAVPLFVGLVPSQHVDEVVSNLVKKVHSDEYKLKTGFLGTRPLIHTLVDHDHASLAYKIVNQPERPGWVYMIRQGATTMWERWDSDDRIGNGMNSFNHSPFNFISEWFYYALAGIRFDDSMHGAASIQIEPSFIEDIDWVRAELNTVNGSILSHWERKSNQINVEIEVPWNTDAVVKFPNGSNTQIMEGNMIIWDSNTRKLSEGISSINEANQKVSLKISPGTYEFTFIKQS